LAAGAGAEVFPPGIFPAGETDGTTGDAGVAGVVRAGADVVRTGVTVAMGVSGFTHPVINIIRTRRPTRKIPGYFIEYSHSISIKNLILPIRAEPCNEVFREGYKSASGAVAPCFEMAALIIDREGKAPVFLP
jgi:hypothetical protein